MAIRTNYLTNMKELKVGNTGEDLDISRGRIRETKTEKNIGLSPSLMGLTSQSIMFYFP